MSRLKDIKAWIDERDPHATIIPFSAGFEQTVSTMFSFVSIIHPSLN